LLPDLPARALDALVECVRGAHQSFQRHGAGGVRHAPEALDVHQRHRRDGGVGLRAVDQRDPFLRLQHHG